MQCFLLLSINKVDGVGDKFKTEFKLNEKTRLVHCKNFLLLIDL